MAPIKDHPQRLALTGEMHARPFPQLAAPSRVAFLAVKFAPGCDAKSELNALLAHYGAPRADAEAKHYYGEMGRFTLKWEQHTEFVTYTVIAQAGQAAPFAASDFDVFPDDWLSSMQGERITSALVVVLPKPGDDAEVAAHLQDWFVPESLAVAEVLEGASVVASDFRIDPAGHMRLALFTDASTGQRRIGRIVQRLCEIETYKAMSMLGFMEARGMATALNDLDGQLSTLMGAMRSGAGTAAEETLHALLDVSVALEALTADTAYRFAATGAYEAIVYQRISALREERFMGRQGFGEFMMRRYEPAMRTVKSTEARLQTLSGRALRAADLLRTRVDVERSAQNQAILASMDRRADLQLRLQHTVEGLSVVAISYYAVSLAGYLLYPAAERLGVSKGVLTAIVTLPVVLGVWLMLRRLRRKIG
ncbi:DUF3422 domain-containing protein [Sulfitobacter sp. S0837]|uniref:DUF3422 family protein n=1 Tax=Sulfitobacter maritimus TaxID=2741719 RepID=UPI00158182DF|nr:DUF3422 domain-containing protein [Sulfitobacter maritimus]NUH66209.1 DUF3422 domain-containing protein [Sulfitobacter maritimus]